MPTAFRTALNPTVSSGLPVSGAVLWLDASQQNSIFTDAGVTPVSTNGDLVYQWNDLSGNGRHAIQSASANRPTWKSPANGQNGLGAIGFSGSNQYLVGNSAGVSGSFTFYMVFVRNNAAGTQIPFEWGTQTTGNWRSFQSYYGNTTTDGGMYFAGYFRDLTAISLTLAYGTASAAAFSYDGTSMSIQRNANTVSGAVSLNSISALNANIGRSVTGSYYLNGKICEIVLYSSSHNSTVRSTMYNYLKSKWGTP